MGDGNGGGGNGDEVGEVGPWGKAADAVNATSFLQGSSSEANFSLHSDLPPGLRGLLSPR